MLIIPGSACPNERCFSVLRRLKNYLRTRKLQDRMNDVAILHICHDIVDQLDTEILLIKFITQNSKRPAVFALCRK